MGHRSLVQKGIERILIFRLGSIGDFVVSLPCLHTIRRSYPHAEIALLTNMPIEDRASSAMTILEHTGLVDRFLFYPVPLRACGVKKQIGAFSPDVLVYLAERRSMFLIYRDYAFFFWCGIRKFVGLSFRVARLLPSPTNSDPTLWEAEASRLARSLAQHFGNIDLDSPQNWDLHLTERECGEASQVLSKGFGDDFARRPLLGISIGTKQPINDWGIDNWRKVVEGLKGLDRGLVLIGSGHERGLSDQLAGLWSSPTLNLCGLLSPRVSAAVARHLSLFLCHDSGPMHLAAAVGTPVVAIFSRNNPPGKWFPFGMHHTIFYPQRPGDTIQSITPDEVITAVMTMASSVVVPAQAEIDTEFPVTWAQR